MHEISLVRNIFRTIENEFSAEELKRLSAINLKVGMLSNVEPILMKNALDAVTATDSPQYKDIKLNIETVPIMIECEKCGAHSTVEQYRFICKNCQNPTNNVIKGMELLISGVEFADE